MNIVVTDKDVAIYYEIIGKGYPIIMLHGQYMNTTMFDTFNNDLKNKYQIIKIDLRGHGLSDKPLSITMNDYISDVLTVIDFLYIKDAHFLGYGLGGMVAEAIAIYYPHLVNKLMLISVGNEPLHISESRIEEQYANFIRTLSFQERRKILETYYYKQQKPIKKWMKSLKDTKSNMTNLEIKAVNHSTKGVHLIKEAHLIQAPTLIISGEHDPLISFTAGKELSDTIPNSMYALYEHSGHAPLIEEREHFLNDIKTFFKLSN